MHLQVASDNSNHNWMRDLDGGQKSKPSLTLATASVLNRGPRMLSPCLPHVRFFSGKRLWPPRPEFWGDLTSDSKLPEHWKNLEVERVELNPAIDRDFGLDPEQEQRRAEQLG